MKHDRFGVSGQVCNSYCKSLDHADQTSRFAGCLPSAIQRFVLRLSGSGTCPKSQHGKTVKALMSVTFTCLFSITLKQWLAFMLHLPFLDGEYCNYHGFLWWDWIELWLV